MAPAPAAWAVLSDALWCLGLGCLLAAGRDTVRLALGEGPARCFFCDVAAFAAAAVLVCGFAAGASAGGLARWYMSAAMLLGALCWRRAVQPVKTRLTAARNCRRARHIAKKSRKSKKSAEKRLQKPSKVLYN